MAMTSRTRNWILLVGDAAMLYAALILMLITRVGGLDEHTGFWVYYFRPFTALNLIWLAVFFINDLYSIRAWRVSWKFFQSLLTATVINGAIGAIFFYFNTATGISPKASLFALLGLFTVLIIAWRYAASRAFSAVALTEPVVFLEPGRVSLKFAAELAAEASSPWRVEAIVTRDCCPSDELGNLKCHHDVSVLPTLVNEIGVRTIVVDDLAHQEVQPILYDLMLSGVAVRDAASFWEEVHGVVPLEAANADWFMNSFADVRGGYYYVFKRSVDAAAAAALMLIFSWLILIVAVSVKLFGGPGPILFSQRRIGRFGKIFTLYKFRTMRLDAEKDAAQWSVKDDPRVTNLGRFLRHTHLDEFPQLWNILRGEMSFIGPRPERPEFVEKLRQEIPFYSLRHLVKPGITGWAQINYRYGASVEDARRKLSYDLFYVKHRSLFLDVQIALKTGTMVFRGEGR